MKNKEIKKVEKEEVNPVEPITENAEQPTSEIKETEVPVINEEVKTEVNVQNIVEQKPIDIVPLTEEESNFGETIEVERKKLLANYKKSRRISNVATIVCVLFAIGAFLLLTYKQKGKGFEIGGYVLLGVTIVGLVTFYVITKNKFPNKTKEFIGVFYSYTNRYLYGGEGFKEMNYTPKEKFDMQTILCDRVYKDILQTTSRNIVKGKYLNSNIQIGELALYNAGEKKNTKNICFLGKYISYTNNLHFEGRYIITIQTNPEKKVDLPTDIEDLTASTEGNVTIYCPNDKDPKSVLGAKFINDLKKINSTEPLFNLNVVVWAGHTAAYISYDDVVMNIPFEKEFDINPLNRYIADLKVVLNALKGINK